MPETEGLLLALIIALANIFGDWYHHYRYLVGDQCVGATECLLANVASVLFHVGGPTGAPGGSFAMNKSPLLLFVAALLLMTTDHFIFVLADF